MLSFVPPLETTVAHAALYAPESSATVTLPPDVNDGASLTALTVIVNVCGALTFELGDMSLPLSESVTLIVAVPLLSAAGV